MHVGGQTRLTPRTQVCRMLDFTVSTLLLIRKIVSPSHSQGTVSDRLSLRL